MRQNPEEGLYAARMVGPVGTHPGGGVDSLLRSLCFNALACSPEDVAVPETLPEFVAAYYYAQRADMTTGFDSSR